MKVIKNNPSQLDALFKEARQDQPLMDMKEVEKIVNSGRYVPSAATTGGFHINVTTMIVGGGIVVTSFLAYMTMKSDEKKIPLSSPSSVVATAPEQGSSQPAASQVMYADAKKSHKAEPALRKEDKQRPAVNPDNFTANADNSVIPVNDMPAENVAAVSASNGRKADLKSISRKALSGEFAIGFPYNDQAVEMKLNGDGITELEIDDKTISPDQYSEYADVIAAGRSYLAEKHYQSEANNFELISYFDSSLHSDKILNPGTQYLFELTSSQLLINKIAQSDDAFAKYKSLYEAKTGKSITAGSVFRFEKGYKSE